MGTHFYFGEVSIIILGRQRVPIIISEGTRYYFGEITGTHYYVGGCPLFSWGNNGYPLLFQGRTHDSQGYAGYHFFIQGVPVILFGE